MKIPQSLSSELARWNNGQGVSPLVWISMKGSFHDFVGHARLIWPDFLERDNRIYLADFFEAERLENMLANGASARDAQAFMNALCVENFFEGPEESRPDDEIRSMAEFLKETWEAKLSSDYPGRPVHVLIEDNLNEEGVHELLLTLVDEKVSPRTFNTETYEPTTASKATPTLEHMKNIQIIDGALNAVFDIFAATADEFALIFPGGQDIAFIDEVMARGPEEGLNAAFSNIWKRRVPKAKAMGIHGVLFYGLEHKKQYYPSRKDEEAINPNGSLLR